MYRLDEIINTTLYGHALDELRNIPPNTVDMSVTSPPYYGLRDYQSPPQIWDGDPNCEHEVCGTEIKQGSFCSKCGAWMGQLGLEPSYDLYIKHLCDIFDEVKRVLKPTGSLWVNIGDSYYGGTEQQKGIRAKSLIGIPDRFKIEMINRGWICRNEVIWEKPNSMPSSVDDRFTVDYEKFFFFTRSNDTQYWTNKKTLQLVTKKPLGTKGEEGTDWEYIPCPKCIVTPENGANTGENNKKPYMGNNPHRMRLIGNTKIPKEMSEKLGSPRARYHRVSDQETCTRCNGTGKVQSSLWSGHDYFFEQQFEPHKEESKKRAMRGNNENKYSNGKHLPPGVHSMTMSQPRQYRGYENMEEAIANGETPLNPEGRNKRCVWDVPEQMYEIIVNGEDGELFKVTVPQSELINCFGDRNNNSPHLMGSVWDIPTKPCLEADFAVYPQDLIHTPIMASCPESVCKKCGMPRVKVTRPAIDIGHVLSDTKYAQGDTAGRLARKRQAYRALGLENPPLPVVIGESDCGCGAGWELGIVLDPFGGSGTTAKKARKENRSFIAIEINPGYVEIANKGLAQKTMADWIVA